MSTVISVSAGMKGKVQETAVGAALFALETLTRRQDAEVIDGGDGKIQKNLLGSGSITVYV